LWYNADEQTITDLASRLTGALSRFNESQETADSLSPVSSLGGATMMEANEEGGLFSSNEVLRSAGSEPEQCEGDGGPDNNSDYSDTFDSEIDGLDIEEIIGDIIAAEGQREDQDALRGVGDHGSQDEVEELSGGEEPDEMSLEGVVLE